MLLLEFIAVELSIVENSYYYLHNMRKNSLTFGAKSEHDKQCRIT
jgi:hypothetical protein